MKALVRNTVFNSIALFIASQLLPGVRVAGGIKTLILSGLVLSILFRVLKPVLNLFSLPLNVVTLGLFSFFINTILLYILTVFIPDVSIAQFTFNGFSFAGFVVPVFHFNSFWAYVVTAGVLSAVINFFDWLIKK